MNRKQWRRADTGVPGEKDDQVSSESRIDPILGNQSSLHFFKRKGEVISLSPWQQLENVTTNISSRRIGSGTH
jgi:hypothetical protein